MVKAVAEAENAIERVKLNLELKDEYVRESHRIMENKHDSFVTKFD